MKKTKHILINLTETEYKTLLLLAAKHKRKLAEFCALKLLDSVQDEGAELLRVGAGSFEKATFKI